MEMEAMPDIEGMTNESNNPNSEETPNYYGGGVPSAPQQPYAAPQPDNSNPYANQSYGNAAPQKPYEAPQQPYAAPQNFNNPYGNPAQQQQPQYMQPQYQPPMPNYGVAPQSSTNKNALISLITSLVTLFILCGIPLVGTVAAIVGIVFGHKALKETKDVPNSGNGVAIAGTICGYVALAASIIVSGFILLIIVAAAMDGSTY